MAVSSRAGGDGDQTGRHGGPCWEIRMAAWFGEMLDGLGFVWFLGFAGFAGFAKKIDFVVNEGLLGFGPNSRGRCC